MCDTLGLRILAEGVETVEEQMVLQHLGLRYVQGFLFARPLAISALDGYLDATPARASRGNVA